MKQADIETTVIISSTSWSADKMEACLQWRATDKAEEPEHKILYECKPDYDLEEDELLEQHISYACSKLEAKAAEISNLPSDCEFVIWCVIYSKSHFVGAYLNTSLINRLARLNASVSLSFYEGDSTPDD